MLDTQVLAGQGPASGAGGGGAGGGVLVLMHGRGADPSDLAPLRRWLPDGITLVLPRAPHHAARWGYGPGWAWYRYEGEDRPEEGTFRASQEALDALVDGMTEVVGFQPEAVFIGGFSQGGTMSLGYAMRHPGSAAGVVNFSGFLPDHPDVQVTPATAPATPIFWGHGTADPAIPFQLASRGRERLRAAGATLETRDYPMGHGIIPEEVRDAVAWIDRVRGTGGGEAVGAPRAEQEEER